MIPGRGIIAVLESKRILAGNIALLEENHIEGIEKVLSEVTDFVSEGCTIIYVAIEGKAVGFISLADTLRPDAPNVVSEIRVAGAIPVLLTGDHENVAKTIATSLSIREFHAACLPEDKLKFITSYQEKKEKVCSRGLFRCYRAFALKKQKKGDPDARIAVRFSISRQPCRGATEEKRRAPGKGRRVHGRRLLLSAPPAWRDWTRLCPCR